MIEAKVGESRVIDKGALGFLNNTLRDIMSAVHAECGSLFLFDSDHKELVLNSFYNSKNLYLQGLRKRMGEGVAGKIADIKAPILVKDIGRDVRFQRNGFSHYRTNSFISVPLFIAGDFIGLINVADKTTGEPFSEKDLTFVTAIAKYASHSVEVMLNWGELKQEKDALDAQKSQLEKYATVGKLAAGVVHEVNNPLDGVIRYTNMLLNQIDSNSVAHEYLSEIKKGLNRIANTTKSLIEFSHRVNSGSAQAKKYVDIHSLIDEAIGALHKDMLNGIAITRTYDRSLPKILDMGLSHVVTNMIKNSLDAMPMGGTLEISTAVDDKTAQLTFKDSGFGISRKVLDRIFEPFFTTKGIGKGTGLGLSICNEIIHTYKGKIKAESEEGKGSSFIILIPKRHLENG